MKVLRHEEFKEQCEAGCNGKINSPWSKTMIGYGPEQNNFALELTYNYRVRSYHKADDLQYISIYGDYKNISESAKSLGYVCDDDQ